MRGRSVRLHGIHARAQARVAGLGALAAALLVTAMPVHAGPQPDAARRAQLARMVLQDCGSCHGMTLRGGLGPPLTAASLRDRDEGSLQATILSGRAGTAMPPWRAFLSEAEAAWIARQLRKGGLDEASTATKATLPDRPRWKDQPP